MNRQLPLRTILLLTVCVVAAFARGKLVNAGQKPRETSGRRSAEQVEYDGRTVETPDTAEAHWKLATWCLENKLLRERKEQLQRVIELDPDHGEARRILGFQRVGEQWMSRAEEMQSRGYILYEGHWRTPQDIEIRERRKRIELAENTWRKKTRLWRSWLGRSNVKRRQEAREGFLAANDPYAAPGIADLLAKEKVYAVKLLLLESLSDIRHPRAVNAISEYALKDADSETRHQCIEYLIRMNDSSLVGRFVKSLGSNHNVEVNRAAVILGSLGFPSAVSPLIDVLVTKHKIKNPNAGRTNARFSPSGGGGGGLSMGGKPYVTVELKNQEVLNALVRITRQSFQFDRQAWHRWYTTSQREGEVDMRRD